MSASAKVGRAIRRIRKAQGRSALDLAPAIGVSKVEMTRKETGESPFSVDQVEAIAKELGYPLLNLMKEASTPQDDLTIELVAAIAALPPEKKAALAEVVQGMLSRNKRVSLPSKGK